MPEMHHHVAHRGLSVRLSFCVVARKCCQYALYSASLLVVAVFISVSSYSVSVGKQFFFSSFNSGIVKNTWKISVLYLPVILALLDINYMQSK